VLKIEYAQIMDAWPEIAWPHLVSKIRTHQISNSETFHAITSQDLTETPVISWVVSLPNSKKFLRHFSISQVWFSWLTQILVWAEWILD